MAIVFFGFGGNNSTGDGSVGNPYLDYDVAVTNSTAGDTVAVVDGIAQHQTAHYIFDDNRIVGAESFRGGALTPAAGETTRTVRTSGNLSAANNPFRVENIVIDGLGQTTQSLEIVRDAVEDLIIQLHNVWVKPGATYNIFLGHRRGRIEVVNLKLTGGKRAFSSTTSLAGDANQVIDINGIELDLDFSVNTFAIQLTKINNLTNSFDVFLKGLRGSVNVQLGVSVTCVDIRGCAAPVISGFNFTVTGDGTANGILVRGQSVAVVDGAIISGGTLNFLAGSGYGLSIGQSDIDAFVTSGSIMGNTIKGMYFSNKTPHNISLGMGVIGDVIGNVSTDGYVGVLASRCTNASISGNLLIDCYGPNIYIKGTIAATVSGNVCLLTGKYVQRSNGILSVTHQTGVNTISASISKNLVIVSDTAKINSLAFIEDANQVCTYSNNTYIISDTVDLSTELLFSYHAGTAQPANQTLAQWNANTEVTSDVVIQMPQAELVSLIDSYTVSGSAGAGAGLYLEIAPNINILL